MVIVRPSTEKMGGVRTASILAMQKPRRGIPAPVTRDPKSAKGNKIGG